MAPKKRSSSPAPKPKAKAKAKEEPAPDPKALLEKEAEETFDRYEDGGIVKLSAFAECIRAVNIKKCQVFGDEPGPIIKEHWKNCGGFSKKEIDKAGFVAWWPTFMEFVDAEVAKRDAEDAAREAEKKAKADEKAKRFEGDGIWYIPLDDLKSAMDEAHKKGKTPLIIDNTEGQRAEAFFLYTSAYIVECKKMIMDKAKNKEATVESILEEERDRFFRASCFKRGQTVVFRLANSALDVKGSWSSEAFPIMKLLDATEVKKVLGNEQAENFKGSPFMAMCKEEEDKLEHTCMGVNENFRVIAITQFKEEDYSGFLENMFPLDLCQVIKINVT